MRAPELKKILDLSNTLSRCGSNHALIEDVLPEVMKFFGGDSISLSMYKQQGSKEWHGDWHSPSLEQSWIDRYRSQYHHLDPFTHTALERRESGLGSVVITKDLGGQRAYAKSEFLKNFLQPQSIYHMLCICLTGEDQPIAFLGVHRSDKSNPFSNRDRSQGEMLEPALSATVNRLQTDKHLAIHRWLSQRLAQNFPAKAVFFVDEDLNLLFADTRARQMLASVPEDQPTSDWLPRDIQQSCRRLLQTDSPPSEEISLSTQKGMIDGVVHSQLLPTGRPGFLVVLGSVADSVLSESVAAEFAFTPREFEVVNLIFAGLSNTVIADKLEMSVRTVQNHLRAIYSKAEVHNRTSLVNRLILASAAG